MSDRMQYKNFSTRRFRADLHYRLRLLAAVKNCSQEEALNYVVEAGLRECEKQTGLTATVKRAGQ